MTYTVEYRMNGKWHVYQSCGDETTAKTIVTALAAHPEIMRIRIISK